MHTGLSAIAILLKQMTTQVKPLCISQQLSRLLRAQAANLTAQVITSWLWHFKPRLETGCYGCQYGSQ